MTNEMRQILAQLDGQIVKTACFTGSRPNRLRGYAHDLYVPFVDQLTELLTELARHGVTRFDSGAAQGMDQLAFWAVDKTKKTCPVQNIVYQPFVGQEKRWLAKGLFSQAEYRTMLKYADEIVVVTKSLKTDDYRAVCKALDDRNHAMVDDADLVIALYPDDSWITAHGSGTANCMQYARRMRKTILQLKYLPGGNTPLVIAGAKLWVPGEY